MDSNVEQNIEIEERPDAPVKPKQKKPPEPISKQMAGATHPKDKGDWKYKPWNGKDHWVHATTGASTFNLKTIK